MDRVVHRGSRNPALRAISAMAPPLMTQMVSNRHPNLRNPPPLAPVREQLLLSIVSSIIVDDIADQKMAQEVGDSVRATGKQKLKI